MLNPHYTNRIASKRHDDLVSEPCSANARQFNTINLSASEGVVGCELDQTTLSANQDDVRHKGRSILLNNTAESYGASMDAEDAKGSFEEGRNARTSQEIPAKSGANKADFESKRFNRYSKQLGGPQLSAASTAYADGRPWRSSGKAQSVGQINSGRQQAKPATSGQVARAVITAGMVRNARFVDSNDSLKRTTIDASPNA